MWGSPCAINPRRESPRGSRKFKPAGGPSAFVRRARAGPTIGYAMKPSSPAEATTLPSSIGLFYLSLLAHATRSNAGFGAG